MTEKNKKTNIQEELKRAETARAAVDLLHTHEFVNDAQKVFDNIINYLKKERYI